MGGMKTSNEAYQEFLSTKKVVDTPSGFEPGPINSNLFDWQAAIVRWAIRRGRAAIWADCGLGKTLMQLEWARMVAEHTGGNVLILAPLAVSTQTRDEGAKFGIACNVARKAADIVPGVNVANYEMLHHFDPAAFAGVVLDESSILKDYSGKTRTQIIESFRGTPYRLACTATPSPNDYMELGNHAEFLGVMTRVEMLSMFFNHDGGDTSKWQLKKHGEDDFWRWICSWAVLIRKPSDLGFSDDGFELPPIRFHENVISVDRATPGFLFAQQAQGLMERRQARRATIEDRIAEAAALANGTDEQWLMWCDLNDESHGIAAAIPGAVEVSGSDTLEFKERTLHDFAAGAIRVLVSKPSICGHGMNFQSCHNMAFVGLSDSYEVFYQAVRRCWRFGQLKPVNVRVITASTEGAVVANIKRKEREAMEMVDSMVKHMSDISSTEIRGTAREKSEYGRETASGDGWTLHLGDCVDVMSDMESESVGFSIYSPPFASLYTYSNSDRDMGNCKDYEEFMEHFQYGIRELFRITKPGRNTSFHCMQLPISKEREGYIGLRDFRGILIRAFQAEGWIYHSEVCIWKDPVTAMQRTKALGLLWKQIKKDSTRSRMGIADYVVTMRKPGDNPEPVGHEAADFPVDQWQKWASPVWMDIDASDTLQRLHCKDQDDERHICPLQLEVIRRCLVLWSNPGDVVLSPFAGIGSEGYEAIKMDRRFVGIELKRSYFKVAESNLRHAEREARSGRLF